MEQMKTWEECVQIHGHECGGLAIGYQVSRYAMELLDIYPDEGYEVLCVAESAGCPLDGIRVMLGLSVEDGTLKVQPTEERGYNFYNLTTGESVRLVPKQLPEMDRDKMKDFLLQMTYRYLFDRGEAGITL